MRWANYKENRLYAIFLLILIYVTVSDSHWGIKIFSRKFFNPLKKGEAGIPILKNLETLQYYLKPSIIKSNYPVWYYARKSGEPNTFKWIDGLKLLKV